MIEAGDMVRLTRRIGVANVGAIGRVRGKTQTGWLISVIGVTPAGEYDLDVTPAEIALVEKRAPAGVT